jgi:hypothetical protein
VVLVRMWLDASGDLQEEVQGSADTVIKLFLPETTDDGQPAETPLAELAFSMMLLSDCECSVLGCEVASCVWRAMFGGNRQRASEPA